MSDHESPDQPDEAAFEGAPPPPPPFDDHDDDHDTAAGAADEPFHITELTPPPPPPPLGDETSASLDSLASLPTPPDFDAVDPVAEAAPEPPAVDPPVVDHPRVDPPAEPDATHAPGHTPAPAPAPGVIPPADIPPPADVPPPNDVIPPGDVPPPAAASGAAASPADSSVASARWPTTAKAIVAFLVVLALAGIVGTVIGFSRASSAEDEASATSEEVVEAMQRAQAAERELATERAEFADELAQLASERQSAEAEALANAAEADANAAEIAILEAELAEVSADNEELAAALDAAVAAITEIDDLFPVTIEFAPASADIAGDYSTTLTEVSCIDLGELCGSAPALGTSTLASDGGGFRLVVPDVLNVELVPVGGGLFSAAADQALIPPCGDVPRDPALTMALFGDAGSLAADGELTVSALAGSVMIDVPAVDECPPGRVWYQVQLASAG